MEKLIQWYETEKKECATSMELKMLEKEFEKKKQILEDGGDPFEDSGNHYFECIGCGS